MKIIEKLSSLKKLNVVVLLFVFFVNSDIWAVEVKLRVLANRPILRIYSEKGILVKRGSIEQKSDKVVLIRNNFSERIEILPVEKTRVLMISSDLPEKSYYGKLRIEKKENEFSVINIVEDDMYLASVVGSEMDASWPVESLKAQAVASRTLLYYTTKVKKELIISDVGGDFQSYRGANFFNDKILDVVKLTDKQYMTYKGEVFYPYFHSCCGGKLYVPSKSIGLNEFDVYKTIKSDTYKDSINCEKSPYYRWGAVLELSLLEKTFGIRKIENINVIYNDGIAEKIFFNKGDFDYVPGFIFKKKLEQRGINSVKSLKFEYMVKQNKIFFSGVGFGHTCGMCQWGARGLAEKGLKYDEILRFYYGEIKISNLR